MDRTKTILTVVVCMASFIGGTFVTKPKDSHKATDLLMSVDKSDTTSCLHDASTLSILAEITQRGFTSWGCETNGTVRAIWCPPTEGSPVVYFVIDMTVRGHAADTTCVVPIPIWADSIQARVAGVDAQGRQGPWSDLSQWYPVTQ